ncbi:hypothetical protein I316_01886 [Kwoniella heveanensis BCC8398]|uniref:NAD-dependent epimerase/dehydratase domain-containing protein n=1 Tax=Kwoniella heveanensis BCC8398 TaxID=1296120 RepID=A0A1B9H059_9TREE|nr:hypothetical protein I316_01886 [Kwoniella heveanensis BCC8398]
MRILLTGAAGGLGSHTLSYLLSEGHTVIAVDRVPLTETLSSKLPPSHAKSLSNKIVDLTSIQAVTDLFDSFGADNLPEGVIHLAAIPTLGLVPPLETHNINVTSSYNVLYSAASRGIKRIAQASSVNAVGLSFTKEERQYFDRLPLTEKEGYRPVGRICEDQASALVRLFPGTRIASLRFHHILHTKSEAYTHAHSRELWAWSSIDACARSCLLSLTSEGWGQDHNGGGHEAFFIVNEDLIWDGGLSPESRGSGEYTTSALELIKYELQDKNKVGDVDESWWEGNPRRGLWDCSKANILLGWKHVE